MSRKPFLLQCERCGNEQPVRRGGHFSDQDYMELHHEYHALEQQYRREMLQLTARLEAARERIDQLRDLVNVLEVPALPVHAEQPEPATTDPFA